MRKAKKRRGNREGSVFQRADGRWCASVSLPSGKRKSVYGQTREAVAKRLTTLLKQQNDGVPISTTRTSVAGYFGKWLEAKRSTIKPRTLEGYERFARMHIAPAIGKMGLSQVTPTRLEKLYADMLDAGLAPASIRQCHVVLHGMLKSAVRDGLVVRNVADVVQPPRIEKKPMTALDTDGVRRLLEAAAGDKLEALWVMAATTGMRQGELLALAWPNVDLVNGTAKVEATVTPVKGGFSVGSPKTSHSCRTVVLTEVAVDALRRHHVRQAEERLHAGPAWEDQSLVFASERGGHIDGRNLRHVLEPLLAAAGLPRLRFHDLRHTAATMMLEQGVPPKIVSEMLGHSQISITLDLYSHVSEGMQRSAASAIDAALGQQR